jgi:hypothetical protein
MRLLPRRHVDARLCPVDQGSLVTPLQQASHRRPVRLRQHERSHRAFRQPTGRGPKRTPAIPQETDREVTLGLLRLPNNVQRLHEERGQIPPRPNAKARDGDNWHQVPFHPNPGLRFSNLQSAWIPWVSARLCVAPSAALADDGVAGRPASTRTGPRRRSAHASSWDDRRASTDRRRPRPLPSASLKALGAGGCSVSYRQRPRPSRPRPRPRR